MESKRSAKAQRSLTLFMMALKEKLLENKMDDESISDSILTVNVSQAKQAIKEKTFIRMLYKEHNKSAPVAGILRMSKPEFISFAKVYHEKMTDSEASELFNFLTTKKKEAIDQDEENDMREDKENRFEDKLDVMVLENHFEKWFREEDSI